jgi:hypothetical protein
MIETTVRFLVDFRERAVLEQLRLERVQAMTLSELLYWVVFGEEEVPVA